MSEEDLMSKLLSDLLSVGVMMDECDLEFRKYSKTYYGRYYPKSRCKSGRAKVVVYPYESDGSFMSYAKVFDTGMHEFVHHYQHYTGHPRIKGVMHDHQFWAMYNTYLDRAVSLGIVERGDLRAKSRP